MTGLSAAVSATCRAPGVTEATANFECIVVTMIPIGRHAGPWYSGTANALFSAERPD